MAMSHVSARNLAGGVANAISSSGGRRSRPPGSSGWQTPQEAGPGCGPIHGSLVHLVKQVCMGQEGLAGLGAAARRNNDGVEIMPRNREYGQEVAGLATELIACLVFGHHPLLSKPSDRTRAGRTFPWKPKHSNPVHCQWSALCGRRLQVQCLAKSHASNRGKTG